MSARKVKLVLFSHLLSSRYFPRRKLVAKVQSTRENSQTVTAALRVTLRDMTETYVAVAWDRAVPDDHAS